MVGLSKVISSPLQVMICSGTIKNIAITKKNTVDNKPIPTKR